MITEPYQIIAGIESLGSIGTLGIRISIAGSRLPDLSQESIRRVANKAVGAIQDEITAAIKAADPEEIARASAERDELLGCFDAPIYVEQIPNGYCASGCCRHLPWFVVTTPVGRIKIGWRKRVINIDWSETVGTKDSGSLFAGEDVTKGDRYIHAWGADKAKEYVAAIVSSGMNATAQTPPESGTKNHG